MQIYKTKWFGRFARREGISDKVLREAIERAERGLIDAELGGGVIKQRVARAGSGKSGGYRTLVAYKSQHLAMFLSAFAKSDRENIGPDELLSLQETAEKWLKASKVAIRDALENGRIEEVENG